MNKFFNKRDTTLLKGISIIAIFIHHIYQYTSSIYDIIYPYILQIILSNIGNLGCSLFFLVSGYGISHSVNNNPPISLIYILKHLLKLISPFLFIYLLDTIIHYENGFSIMNLITLSITSNDYWFLKEIFIIYIIFLYPCYFYKHTSYLAIILPIIFFFIIFVVKCNESWWWNSTLCFPVGTILYKYKHYINKCENFNIAFIISFFLIFITSFIFSYKYCFAEILKGISFAILMITLVRYNNLKNNIFEIFSKESLKIYLFHIILLQNITIQSPILYVIFVIIGTILLVVIYNLIYKVMTRNFFL